MKKLVLMFLLALVIVANAVSVYKDPTVSQNTNVINGISWFSVPNDATADLQELGAKAIMFQVQMGDVMWIEEYDGLNYYFFDWSRYDAVMETYQEYDIYLCIGQIYRLPYIYHEDGSREIFKPSVTGDWTFLNGMYRMCYETAFRYGTQVKGVWFANEFNEIKLSSLYGWILPDFADFAFIANVALTQYQAFVDVMADLGINIPLGIIFHTDIHSEIHHHTEKVGGLFSGSDLAGPYDWMEVAYIWTQMMPDIGMIGINSYPHYYSATTDGTHLDLTSLASKVSQAKAQFPGKLVMVTETMYPREARDVDLLPPVDWKESRQYGWLFWTYQNCKDAGVDGFFFFNIESPGVSKTYTPEELETLGQLGYWFRLGMAQQLLEWVIENYEYVWNLGELVERAEQGLGVRWGSYKAPGYTAIKWAFTGSPF